MHDGDQSSSVERALRHAICKHVSCVDPCIRADNTAFQQLSKVRKVEESTFLRRELKVASMKVTEDGVAVRVHVERYRVTSIRFQFLEFLGRCRTMPHLFQKPEKYHGHVRHVALVVQFRGPDTSANVALLAARKFQNL